ncbi:MAG: FHA domain-containing protein [Planctomycetota bacterium]|jgi:hypothetical protein
MAYIQIIEGVNKGVILQLDGDTLIGRAPTNVLCLPDSRASREHALLRPRDGGYTISDLGSTNGTSVNETLLRNQESQILQDQDEIVVCSTRMRFSSGESGVPGDSESMPVPPGDIGLTIKGDETSSDHFIDANQDLSVLRDSESGSSQNLLEVVRRLQAMLRISSIAAEDQDRDTLFDRIINTILEVFPVADRALILLPDPQTGEMMPAICRSSQEGDGESFLAISRTIINSVILKRQSILAGDAREEFGTSKSIVDLSISSMMCAPLLNKEEILGVICVESRDPQEQFISHDLEILTGIAHQLGLAVNNLKLSAYINEIESQQ